MDQTNLIDYLIQADKYYEEEKNRVQMVFTWDVGPEVLKTYRKEMLIKPQSQLLNKGNGFEEFL